MSIQSEISRINAAKNEIKTTLENQGISVGEATMDAYPDFVKTMTNQISSALDDILGEVI